MRLFRLFVWQIRACCTDSGKWFVHNVHEPGCGITILMNPRETGVLSVTSSVECRIKTKESNFARLSEMLDSSSGAAYIAVI